MKKNRLAFYFDPETFTETGKTIKDYYEEDLNEEKTVEELFDYAQILLAYIEYDGWKYLINKYGYEKLYEIDKRSGWLSDNSDNLQEYIEWVKHEMDIVKDKKNN